MENQCDEEMSSSAEKASLTAKLNKIRHVHSHPSMANIPPGLGSRSLGSIPNTNIVAGNSSASNGQGSMTSNVTLSSLSSANKDKISQENRSPVICNSTDDNEEIEEDHDGAHDTITSLAGAKMLQR